MRILIAYHTVYGSTQKAAQMIADNLTAQGHTADLHKITGKDKLDLLQYDGVILGTPIFMNAAPKEIKVFLNRYEDDFAARKPGIFFTGASKRKFEEYLLYLLDFNTQDALVAKAQVGGVFPPLKDRKILHRMASRMMVAQGVAEPDISLKEDDITRFCAEYLGLPTETPVQEE